MLLNLILYALIHVNPIRYTTTSILTPRSYGIFTLSRSVLTPQDLQKRQQVLPQGAWSSCDRCPRWRA